MNTEIRKNTDNKSEKDLAKLMNNSIFGKSMENILGIHFITKIIGRPNYKLLGYKDTAKAAKLTQSSDYLGEYIIDENLVLIEMKKKKITFNKPIFTGFAILEISKVWFYEMIYNVVLTNFKDVNIAYVDTDSCVFETSSDPYTTMGSLGDYFDMSVYPPPFHAYSNSNKGKLGTFKDEFASYTDENGTLQLNVIKEFTALRSKCYSLKTLKDGISKCKGNIFS